MLHPTRFRVPQLVSPVLLGPTRFTGETSTPGGGAWPTANLALYCPFTFPVDACITTVSVNCSSGNSAGRNYDIGIYDAAGNRIASLGSTLVAAGINTWTANVAIRAGVTYYIGMSANSTSLAFTRTAMILRSLVLNGVAQQATAIPLPNPFTLATAANAYFPIIAATLSESAYF